MNVAESVNLLWRAMNSTICQIRPDNGMFQQELTQDKGTKDKNQFPKVITLPHSNTSQYLFTLKFQTETANFETV